EKVIVLSFRTLQLQRITELQDDLIDLTVASSFKEGSQRTKDEIDKALRDYAEALRNYETLSLHAQPDIPPGARLVGKMAIKSEDENSRRGLRFPERLAEYLAGTGRVRMSKTITSTISTLSAILTVEYLPPKDVLQLMEKTFGNLGFRELDQKGREERSQKNALTERIIMALFGGAALIGPMLIMTLHQSRNTSLITASVATFLFALVIVLAARDSAGKDVLAITAAYAAVLVVFVGTSTTPST
ncbi:hypothetical protein BDR22DRAFT_785675, partial [Usnea florida]